MLIKLTSDEWQVLREVLAEKGASASLPFDRNQRILELNDDTADDYRNLVQEEFDINGLNQNYEPTPKGKILEALIDKLFTG
jgi:hypothetical protein